MEHDALLHSFFAKERWEQALNYGVEKHLNHSLLREMAQPDVRIALYRAICSGDYRIQMPRCVHIPKDVKGEYRTVYINDDADRVILHIINDLLMDSLCDMIHPSCCSYRKGVGCGAIVRSVAQRVKASAAATDGVIGWKSDLSKYFDSVPLEAIDSIFDTVERRLGRSALVAMLREYYHTDEFIDLDGIVRHKYMSLRQGCAVSSFLANVVLKQVDEKLSALNGYYVRYSDDMLFIGPDYAKAMRILEEETSRLGLSLNPNKLQYLHKDEWFHFLGFSIRNGAISLSPLRIKRFQQEVERRTIRMHGSGEAAMRSAVYRVQRFLYVGNGEFSWAKQVLSYVNCKEDVLSLNNFVMDCLRAVQTGKTKVGGLGFDKYKSPGCIARGCGRHVKQNMAVSSITIDGYISIQCMQNALKTSHEAFDALTRDMICAQSIAHKRVSCAHNSKGVE